MSELRSVLDQMAGIDDTDLSVEELASDLVELAHVGQMVEVLRARKIRSLADQGGHHSLGYSSPTAFLVDQTGVSPGHARRVISYGNAVERAPHAHAAWADGRLSTDQAQHLFRAAEGVPDVYPVAEERLVEIVEGLDAVVTGMAVEYWRQSVDGPGELDAETRQQRRGLSVSETSGGMRRVDGWLTPLAGEALETALTALTPPPRHDDHRTPRQRRHDALEDLCRDWASQASLETWEFPLETPTCPKDRRERGHPDCGWGETPDHRRCRHGCTRRNRRWPA